MMVAWFQHQEKDKQRQKVDFVTYRHGDCHAGGAMVPGGLAAPCLGDRYAMLPYQARSGQVIVERVQRLHIICSLKGRRFGYSPLAHAALHLHN
jgi:hypothetical protein